MATIPCTYGRCRAPSTTWVAATGPDGHQGGAVCETHTGAAQQRARRLTGGTPSTEPLPADVRPRHADHEEQLQLDI
ncbi:MAG: hypothetical protein ACOCUN_00315 [Jiangellaceae bacterium]